MKEKTADEIYREYFPIHKLPTFKEEQQVKTNYTERARAKFIMKSERAELVIKQED